MFEQPDSLAPVVERPSSKSRQLRRSNASLSLRSPPVGNAKVLEALFAPMQWTKSNTESIEVGANQLVSACITAHRPTSTLPLAEAKDSQRFVAQPKLKPWPVKKPPRKPVGLEGWQRRLLFRLCWCSATNPEHCRPKELLSAMRADMGTVGLAEWI